MFRLNPKNPTARSLAPLCKQFCQGSQRGLPSDHDLCRLHLFLRLYVVADVGEKHTPGFLNKQQAGAAGKSAKISNVRKMTDEKRIKPRGGKMLPELVLPYT